MTHMDMPRSFKGALNKIIPGQIYSDIYLNMNIFVYEHISAWSNVFLYMNVVNTNQYYFLSIKMVSLIELEPH